MATFKIFGSKEDKAVLLKGKINDFKDYKELKDKIIDASRNSKLKQQKIKERENFILNFMEDKKSNSYIQEDLTKGIWDNKTFSYFKEKLNLRGIQNGAYKFNIEKVQRLPKWKRKENHEILNEALDASWGPINEDIINSVTLNKLEESKVIYNKKKEQLRNNEEKLNNEEHENVVCNNCFKKDFHGKRFICSECNNYNLCQECEKIFYQKQIHNREHTLIQVNKSLTEQLFKYNNIIGNNNQEFKNVPSSFQLEISIINSGENDLKNCYILPVRFGDEYLTCNPKIVNDEVQRNMSLKIVLVVRVPHNNKGYFEGYFRMFTPNGMPFGNVLCVKVLNGD
jgi:hypothetical protein